MGRASCITCCDRRRRTTLMHESTSPQRTGWTTVTWSSRRRQEKTGESDSSLLNLLFTASLHSTSDLQFSSLTNPLSALTFTVLFSVIISTLSMLVVCSVLCALLISSRPFHEALSKWVSSEEALRCTGGHSLKRHFYEEPQKYALPGL